jgi:hypothetical protein
MRTKKTENKDLQIIIGELYELVSHYNLIDSFQDLYHVAVVISNEWNRVEDILETPSKDFKKQAEDANTLSIALKRMIKLYDKDAIDFIRITEIQFEGGFSITSPEIIREFLGDIDIRSIIDLMEWRKNLLDEVPEIKKGTSVLRGFICSTLLPFFKYLNNETLINAKSENEIYRFIHKFCIIAGADLDVIYRQKPENYLKRTFYDCLNK